MSETPQWVRIACQRWGRQKRRLWAGGDWYRDHRGIQRRHVDGYANSFLGRLLEEREGASQGILTQHWEEVLWGDGLDVQRALHGVPLLYFDVMHLHYVFDPEFGLTAARKSELLGLASRRTYWSALDRGEFWVFSQLEPRLSASFACTVSANPGNSSATPLHCDKNRGTNPRHTANLPDLCLTALERPTLKLARK